MRKIALIIFITLIGFNSIGQKDTLYNDFNKINSIGLTCGIGYGARKIFLYIDSRYSKYFNQYNFGLNLRYSAIMPILKSISFGPDYRYYFNSKKKIIPFIELKSNFLYVNIKSYSSNYYSLYPYSTTFDRDNLGMETNNYYGLANTCGFGLNFGKISKNKFKFEIKLAYGMTYLNKKIGYGRDTNIRLNYFF